MPSIQGFQIPAGSELEKHSTTLGGRLIGFATIEIQTESLILME